jgi:iron complex outermembrane receptor protein
VNFSNIVSAREGRNRRLLLGVALACIAAQPALAQSESESTNEDGNVLTGDIVVTANKREESLQRVGVAATALSGESLSNLGMTQTSDLARIVPAFSINYVNPSISQTNIRGVSQNDFADHLEPPIAVYQDEGYVGTSGGSSVPMFDMQRVEVLRGPQGTLFGRNATGGLIHFISAQPTDHLDGYVQASYGRFNTYNLEGAISGPLSDTVRGRIAFARNASDGPYTNSVKGLKSGGNTGNWGVRAIIDADLGENTELRILGKFYRDDQRGPQYAFSVGQPGPQGLGVAVAPNQIGVFPNIILGGTINSPCAGCNVVGKSAPSSPWDQANNYPGYFKRDFWGVQGKLTHDFGGIKLTAISDYLVINKDTKFDVDMSPQNLFIYGSTQDYKQFSQELRLDGESGALKYVAGVYYLNMRGYYTQPLDLDVSVYVGAPLCVGAACGPGSGNAPAHFEPRYSDDIDSVAVFAQGEYALNDQVSLTLGARFTHDSKKFDYAWSGAMPWVAQVPYNDTQKFDNVAIKAQVDWRPTDGTLIYASYTRGHKGGNWAAPAFPPILTQFFPHDQEVLTSYEGGFKSRFLDNKVTLNGSIYYYDYHNYQAFSLQGLAQSIFNKDGSVFGGELELRTNPAKGLEIATSIALMDSKVKSVALPNGSVVDRVMPNTPKFQATAIVRYAWPMFRGEMSLQASGKYMGDHYLTVLNEPINFEKHYATVDLRAGWQTSDGKVDFSIYAQNITGKIYRMWALDVSPLSLGMNVLGPRATYGARIKYNF